MIVNKQTFRDNLRNTFLKYSVRPLLVLLLCFICLFMLIGSISISYKSGMIHSTLSSKFYSTIQSYNSALEELRELQGITTERLSTTKQNVIKQKLNAVYSLTGVASEIYVLDAERNINYSDQDDLSADIMSAARYDWPLTDIWMSRGMYKRIYLCQAVYSDSGELTGHVVIALRDLFFTKMLGEYNLTNVITDHEDWVFTHTGYQYVDAIGKLAQVYRAGYTTNTLSGFFLCNKGLFYRVHTFDPLYQISVYTFYDCTDTFLAFFTCVITAILLITIMTFFFKRNANAMAVKMTADVEELQRAFEAASEGNLRVKADIHSSAEFEAIGQDFHMMLSNLEEHIQRNRELAEAVAMEQVKQLGGQFNTHFLYNTLDNIRFICQVDPPLAERMVLSLSALLRYSNSSINEQVSIEEDLGYLAKYLEILNVRFMDRMSFEMNIEPKIMNCMTIKLLLQPLVENSIKYGFKEDEELHISIDAKAQGDIVIFTCKDNGRGIDAETLSLLQNTLDKPENTTKHLGLYNINRRIKLLYGEEYGIHVESRDGTSIEVRIPLCETFE